MKQQIKLLLGLLILVVIVFSNCGPTSTPPLQSTTEDKTATYANPNSMSNFYMTPGGNIFYRYGEEIRAGMKYGIWSIEVVNLTKDSLEVAVLRKKLR